MQAARSKLEAFECGSGENKLDGKKISEKIVNMLQAQRMILS